MKRVIRILENHGPMLSGDIGDRLVSEYGMSSLAARKAISRATPPVRKLISINFDNNQKFIYLEQQFNREYYLEAVLEHMKKQSKAYYAFVQALIFHNGFLDKKQLTAYTFSPIKPLKGHRPASKIIDDLCATQIFSEYNEDVLQLNPDIMALNYPKYRAIELAKKITIDHFYDWAKCLNMVAYNSAKLLSDSPEFFKFQWGFTSPSYISGIKSRKDGPTCFFIADILLGKVLSAVDVSFFIQKIKTLRQQKKISPFIPILIMDNPMEKTVFDALKAEGIVLGFVDKLFGASYSEALKSLVHMVEHAGAIIAKKPENYFEFIDKISVLEGKSINLKGDLFELAVGYYYSKIAPYFEINKIILDHKSGKRKEIDVFVRYSDSEIRIIECKGYNYPVGKEFIKKWLTDNIPTIRNWLLSQDEYSNKNLVFELWSTGGFEKEAMELLDIHSNRTQKYIMQYYGKQEIKQIVKDSKNANFQRIMNSYY